MHKHFPTKARIARVLCCLVSEAVRRSALGQRNRPCRPQFGRRTPLASWCRWIRGVADERTRLDGRNSAIASEDGRSDN